MSERDLAAALKDFRRANGWRQSDLAAHFGLDQPAISEMERGLREVPDEIAAELPHVAPGAGVDESSAAAASEPPSDPPPGPAEPSSGDVPPRRTPRKRPVVVPREVDLTGLEARVLALIRGEDVGVPVSDPGMGENVRYESAHVPGLADLVGLMDEFDGEVIRLNAPAMAKAWVNLAREKPRVRQFLEAMTAGGAWRGVITTTAPVILAILLHHGLLPAGVPGLGFTGDAGGEYDGADGSSNGAGPLGGSLYEETSSGSVG